MEDSNNKAMRSSTEFYRSSRATQKLAYGPGVERIYSEWIGHGKVVLDIGCHEGYAGSDLIKNNNVVYGVDIVKDNVDRALSKGIKAIHLDITEDKPLPFEDNFFDVIIAGEVIEHVLDTDHFMRKIYSKLKTGGLLVLSTPNLASLGRRLLLLLGKNPYCEYSLEEKVTGAEPAGHIRYFVKQDLVRFLKKHGFKVVTIVSDRFNLGFFSSKVLGVLFPGLGWRLIVKAVKVEQLLE